MDASWLLTDRSVVLTSLDAVGMGIFSTGCGGEERGRLQWVDGGWLDLTGWRLRCCFRS